MQQPDQTNVATTCSDGSRKRETVDAEIRLPSLVEQGEGGPGVPSIGIGEYEGVEGHNVPFRNSVEQVAGIADVGLLPVGRDEGVEREDVGMRGEVEGRAGGGEAAAFGVEEDEVVGEISGGRDGGLEVEGMEGFAGEEILAGYGALEEVPEAVGGP